MTKGISIFTQTVLAGHPGTESGAVPAMPPIIPAVGFVHPSMAETDQALGSQGGSTAQPEGYIYARHGAPTQAAFEDAITALEGSDGSLAFSSGMAALHAAILSAIRPGGVIVAAEQLYGTTRTLLNWLADNLGVHVDYVDALNPQGAARDIEIQQPQMVICEALTNPLARVVRFDLLAQAAQAVGAIVLVDNTFATPYLVRPLEHGATLVVHSATKFLNGHGDVTAGVLSGPADLLEKARGHRRVLGAVMGPFDAWLALRGLRTLAIRMQQACGNAAKLAAWLNDQPQVEQVYYPGLPSDPCYLDACTLFRRDTFGAMLAFELANVTRDQTFAFVDCLRVIRPVTSLGDVNTLISHPATSSQRGLSTEQRAAQGIREGTLRLSVGIEDADDLIADLAQAMQALS